MSEIINKALQVLDNTITRNAPRDKGNLSNAIKDTPTIDYSGRAAIINLGEEWATRASKSSNYNYGQLLNDKRVIKNRESKNKKTRMENREKRKFANTRSVWVKDKRYGNTIRITNRQYQISAEKSRTSAKTQNFNETKDYIFVRNDTSIPTISRSSKPVRTNRHYGYMDVLFDEFCVDLARSLGGKLHKGLYFTQEMLKQPQPIINQTPTLNDITYNFDFSKKMSAVHKNLGIQLGITRFTL